MYSKSRFRGNLSQVDFYHKPTLFKHYVIVFLNSRWERSNVFQWKEEKPFKCAGP